MYILNMKNVLRLIHIAIGILSTVQFRILSTFLPSIHGTFLSLVYKLLIPPIIFITINQLLLQRIRPLGVIIIAFSLCTLNGIHVCVFPLSELVILCIGLCACLTHWVWVMIGINVALFIPNVTLQIIKTLTSASPYYIPISSILTSLIFVVLSVQSYSIKAMISYMKSKIRTMTITKKKKKKNNIRTKNELNSNNTNSMSSIQLIIVSIFVFIISLNIQLSTMNIFKTINRKYMNPRKLPDGYHLVDQERSTTGLISVVEKRNSHRMLLADLSVLGGIHVEPYEPNSIFPQFHVHEAVRLSNRNNSSPHTRTLCMGIGVGIVTNAIRKHNCKVDAIEIDKSISNFATQYFHLQGGIHVEDGKQYIKRQYKQSIFYDYIIHDVFSGGFINPNLLKQSQFQLLRSIIIPNGIIVMNIVSCIDHKNSKNNNPFMPCKWVTEIVAKRLQRSFGHIRLFTENDYNDQDNDDHLNEVAKKLKKFSVDNVVLFASPQKQVLQFRKPVEDDYLNSEMRADVLNKFDKFERKNFVNEHDNTQISWWQWIIEETKLWIGMAHVGLRHAQIMRIVHPAKLWSALVAAEVGMNA